MAKILLRDGFIEEIQKIRKSLKPTLVRRIEQLKGIEWFVSTYNEGREYNSETIKEIKKRYGDKNARRN